MYRWIEHTSEIELLIEGETPEAVLAEALVALRDALPETRDGEPLTREVSASAPDLPALLAAWLEELVYLAETDGFVPKRVVRMQLEGTRLVAVVGGVRSVPQSLIKAVTYHRLEMRRANGIWSARVVLDV